MPLIRWNKTDNRFEPAASRDDLQTIELGGDEWICSAVLPASYDGPGSPIGTGFTPARALEALLERLAE